MKLTYGIIAVLISCFGLGYAGKIWFSRVYDSSSRTTIIYTEDPLACKLSATYPIGKSQVIDNYINNWASNAVTRSGSISGQLHLKFSNGSSCVVHAGGSNLEIIGRRNENDSMALAKLQNDYKSINDFIALQVSNSQKK